MMMKKFEWEVYRILRKVGTERFSINQNKFLSEDLGFDNVDILQMINLLEYSFNIQINDSDFDKISTTLDVNKYIKNQIQLGVM